MIDRHGLTILYTAPTAIRAFMRWGDNYVLRHRLDSLRLLGFRRRAHQPRGVDVVSHHDRQKEMPIVDTWWQTETGCIMDRPAAGVTPTKPGSATFPLFGVLPKIVDENGNEVPRNSGGKLAIMQPWPSMLRTLWGDDDRFKKAYFSEFHGKPGVYFTGDGARQDKDGYLT